MNDDFRARDFSTKFTTPLPNFLLQQFKSAKCYWLSDLTFKSNKKPRFFKLALRNKQQSNQIITVKLQK